MSSNPNSVLEFIKSIFWAVLLAVVLRTFTFESYRIPSGSMYPTNYVGDVLFVNKFTYGYTHYSFLFSPKIFSGRIFGRVPERGDVIVFRQPTDTSVDFIKRVIGLPGERVMLKNGVVHINGTPVQLERTEDYVGTADTRGIVRRFAQYIETLPNGVKHRILKEQPFGMGRADNTVEYTIPEGHLFVLGDNRDNSQDSRYITVVGFVPLENVVGRAEVTYFSLDTDKAAFWELWKWPFAIRYGRMFHLIR